MTYNLTFDQAPEYLHAIVTGRNCRENMLAYLAALLCECDSRSCTRVLIEERLEGPRLGTLEIFDIAVEGSKPAAGKMKAIAYDDVDAEGFLAKFGETVAVHRALPLAVFSSVPDAERWLLESCAREGRPRFPTVDSSRHC